MSYCEEGVQVRAQLAHTPKVCKEPPGDGCRLLFKQEPRVQKAHPDCAPGLFGAVLLHPKPKMEILASGGSKYPQPLRLPRVESDSESISSHPVPNRPHRTSMALLRGLFYVCEKTLF